MRFIRFFHKVFRPNCICAICSAPRCQMCDEYKSLIQQLTAENRAMLNSILEVNKPIVSAPADSTEEIKPIHMGRRGSLAVLRTTLEAADRLKAQEKKASDNIKVQMNSVPAKTEEEVLKEVEELVGHD